MKLNFTFLENLCTAHNSKLYGRIVAAAAVAASTTKMWVRRRWCTLHKPLMPQSHEFLFAHIHTRTPLSRIRFEIVSGKFFFFNAPTSACDLRFLRAQVSCIFHNSLLLFCYHIIIIVDVVARRSCESIDSRLTTCELRPNTTIPVHDERANFSIFTLFSSSACMQNFRAQNLVLVVAAPSVSLSLARFYRRSTRRRNKCTRHYSFVVWVEGRQAGSQPASRAIA